MALKNFFPRGTENGACESRKSEYNLARRYLSYRELASMLFESVTKKTALNKKQYFKVAYYYFIDRYIFCK